MMQRASYIGTVSCAIIALSLVASAQSPPKPSVVRVIGKPIGEIEAMYGKSQAESKSSISKRIFTVSGFKSFRASIPWVEGLTEEAVAASIPDHFTFSLKDRKASWQKFFVALGIPTSGVKWTKRGKSAQVASGVKGLPKGWEILYTLYPEQRDLVISKH